MKIFKVDSPFMLAMGKAADFLVVNIFFIVTCLPIVTIGAATTALYTVSFQLSKDEENYNYKNYWQAFKANFKESTKAWLLLLLLTTMLGIDFKIIQQGSFTLGKTLLFAILLMELLLLVVIIYIFPYIAKFENSLRRSLLNVLIIGIASFPYTILLVALLALCLLFVLHFSVVGSVLAFFCGFAMMAYLSSLIFNKVFSKYESS